MSLTSTYITKRALDLLLQTVCLLIFLPIAIAQDELRLNKLKAGFVLNFAKFATWPSEIPSNLHICYFGINTTATTAFEEITGIEVKGIRTEVKFVNFQSLKNCHLLYIPSGVSEQEINRALDLCKDAQTLVVTDSPGKGMINIFLVDNKLHFEIFPNRLAKAQIKISSQLLKLATIRDED